MINLLLLKINIPRRKMHSWEKQFKCDHCGKTFLLKTKLTCHQMTHIGEKLFKCRECDNIFFQKADLKCHQRTHYGENLCKCDLCYNFVHLKVVLYVIC